MAMYKSGASAYQSSIPGKRRVSLINWMVLLASLSFRMAELVLLKCSFLIYFPTFYHFSFQWAIAHRTCESFFVGSVPPDVCQSGARVRFFMFLTYIFPLRR